MAAQVEQNNQVVTAGDEEQLKTFKDRLEDMPAYNMTVNGIQSMYDSLKGYQSLSGYINTAENVAGTLTNAAKPVVVAATNMALKVAKPVVGEVKDPVASLDGCAAEVLAKVQEKVPCVKQDPYELAAAAKSSVKETKDYYIESAKNTKDYYIASAKDTKDYYVDKLQNLTVTQAAVKQIDNAVAYSDLLVELCLPTDPCSIEDMVELERQEESEDQGVVARARHVKEKACRRGTRKLMSCSRVKNTVDMVQYVQNRISETTGKLIKGSNYVPSSNTTTTSTEPGSIHDELKASEQQQQQHEQEGRDFVSEEWESIHKTSMFLPKKALQMTGEVYTSAKEMVFVYSSTNALKEMPTNVVNMVESYYKKATQDGLLDEVKDKVVSFAYVPTQVITNYVQSNRLVQWIIPNSLQQEEIQVIEIVNDDSAQ